MLKYACIGTPCREQNSFFRKASPSCEKIGENMKYTAVIFGLDGTLLNTLSDLTDAVNKALAKGGYPARTEAEIAEFTGKSTGELIRRAVPKGTTWEESWELIAPCNEYYSAPASEKTVPYDGIVDLLDKLKAEGVKIAAISQKPQEAAEEMAKAAFGDRLDVVVGEKEESKKIPAPDMIFEIIDKLGVNNYEVLVVGDNDCILQTAKNAGVKCINVTWGFKTRYFLENHSATDIVDTAEELLAKM